MKRRTVLAGVGSVGLAATAGCSGVLGGGGGCSVPSDRDLDEMLPESGGGFERETVYTPGGGSQGIEDSAIGVYTRDGIQYVFMVAEYEDEEAAEEGLDDANADTSEGMSVVVRSRAFVFAAGVRDDGATDESTLRTLLERSVLGEGCVDANARTFGG